MICRLHRAVGLVVLTCLTATSIADEPVFSGPQPGEPATPFKVVGVYDGQAGKEFDPIAEAGGKPVLLVFMHQLTRPSAALARALAGYGASRADTGLRTDVVWLTADRLETEQFLTRARKSLNLKVHPAISIDGVEGPGAYGLNRNVGMTVLVINGNKTAANFALVQPSVTDAPKIAAELVKVIGGPAPTLEEMSKLANPGGEYRGKDGKMERPAAAPAPGAEAGAGAGADDLRALMRPLVAADATPRQIAASVKAVEAHVGNDPARQKQLGQMSQAILQRNVGTPEAQKHVKIWAERHRDAGADQADKPRK